MNELHSTLQPQEHAATRAVLSLHIHAGSVYARWEFSRPIPSTVNNFENPYAQIPSSGNNRPQQVGRYVMIPFSYPQAPRGRPRVSLGNIISLRQPGARGRK
jgi:hypothetical protein